MSNTTRQGNIADDAPPIAAAFTPRGRGAVGTVQCRGDCRLVDESEPALFHAANRKPLSEQPHGNVVFGLWGHAVREEVVACRIDDRTFEIHCHGGDAAIERILTELASLGFAVVPWTTMLENREGILSAEFASALAQATTLRTAGVLLEQQSGVLAQQIRRLLSAADQNQPQDTLLAQLNDLIDWGHFGRHLAQPWSVVLAGRPNVGKSSLINALAGFSRSVVFDTPGTTRDVVTVETAFEGWPVELADTAGLRDNADPLESAGIELARDRLADADCRLLLLDISQPPQDDDFRLIQTWPDAILIAHKCDLPAVWGDALPDRAARVSSFTGEGVETIAAAIVIKLIPQSPPARTAIPFTARQIALLEQGRNALLCGDLSRYCTALEAFLA